MSLIYLCVASVISVVKKMHRHRGTEKARRNWISLMHGNKRTHATLFKTGSGCRYFSKTPTT